MRSPENSPFSAIRAGWVTNFAWKSSPLRLASGLSPGDLCAVEAYYFCGECPACRSGKTNCCRNLRVLGVHLDGGHAPLMTVPVDKLHRAAALTPEQTALVEPLVIGAHGVERAALQAGEPVAVLGLGPIGLGGGHFRQGRRGQRRLRGRAARPPGLRVRHDAAWHAFPRGRGSRRTAASAFRPASLGHHRRHRQRGLHARRRSTLPNTAGGSSFSDCSSAR